MLRRSFALLGESKKTNKIYELRTYAVMPSMYDQFNALASEMMPKRPATGSKCQGYWTVQIGPLNEFNHMWEYDSLQHRYDCRKVIDNDKEWNRSYVKPMQSMLMRESNCLLRLVYREGNASTMSYKYMMQLSSTPDVEHTGPSAILAATFQVIAGANEGQYVHILKAKNLDDVIPQPPRLGNNSKIMGPTRWSPALGCLWR